MAHTLTAQNAAGQGEPDARDFRHTSRLQLALDKVRRQVAVDGLGDVGTTGHFELLSILADQYRADRQEELKPDNYAFVSKDTLMNHLCIDSEAALRKRISEFRRSVAHLAGTKWGMPLSQNAVIENRSGKGYRLNPNVVIVDPKERG